MMKRFISNEELFDFGRELRDALFEVGKEQEAREISEVVDGYWSSASESLGEFLISLNSTRDTVKEHLPGEINKKLELAIKQIREAFDRANNP
jgi:hypothetical protein